MFAVYKSFDLIKEKYFIEYWFKKDYFCYAKVYYWESLKPKTSVKIGMVIAYFEEVVTEEDEKQHWTADCHLEPKHMKKELIDSIGKELLERTACKEPFILNVYKGSIADGDFRVYGDPYSKQ